MHNLRKNENGDKKGRSSGGSRSKFKYTIPRSSARKKSDNSDILPPIKELNVIAEEALGLNNRKTIQPMFSTPRNRD